ncbi:hypothetical protein K504DRAFT_521231 [Pleomassaria siparia CBS 279.74]|uniref:Rhodopsin domain-containing protein n=1 Tax=Pleomassaria siparia CBS 279.74 TaxID=1314801 RepID=A0A6G1KGH5_9PLEO|nr:hypothetical protein K504DRAFT_521231 [Pleomassaria siparia CBS 279.74]
MSLIEPESSLWYAFCWIVVITRLISRRLHVRKWQNLQVDDYLIILSMLTTTVLMVLMHYVVNVGTNNLPPDQDYAKLSAREIRDRVFGSKLVMITDQMQIATAWTLKICMLLLYNRMTYNFFVRATTAYVVVTFVVMEILFFGAWCRPFKAYWLLPAKSFQCAAAQNHLLTNLVFNVTSNIILILLPMPILFGARLPLKRKMGLIVVFLMGFFSIMSAIVNKVFALTHPYGNEWTTWYIRETYMAILCANLPLIYPLIRRAFNPRSTRNQSYRSPTTATTAFRNDGSASTRANESQEWINESGENLQIYLTTEFIVTSSIELGVMAPIKAGANITTTKNMNTDTRREDSGAGMDHV